MRHQHNANFLYQQTPGPRARRRRWPWIVAVLLVGIGIWLGVSALAGVQAAAAAADGRDALLRAEQAAADLRFGEAKQALLEAEAAFGRAEAKLVVMRPFHIVPWVGTQTRSIETIISSGGRVIGSLVELTDLGEEILEISGLADQAFDRTGVASLDVSLSEIPPASKQLMLERLANETARLERISTRIDLAREDLARIPRDRVAGPILAAFAPMQQRLEELAPSIRLFAAGSRILPSFVGAGEERINLLLFLNNAELRPGGGFIGTFGILRMMNGEIRDLATSDVYTLDDAAAPAVTREPPLPLQTYNAAQKWFFRDANWSPDFAVSSRQALELFHQEVRALPFETRQASGLPAAVHNVVGMTPDFASDLLRVTGPITVQNRTFTPENIRDLLVYEVEFGFVDRGEAPTERKRILSQLIERVQEELLATPLSEWGGVTDAIDRGFTEKQFVLYSEDQPTQTVIARAGWGGRVDPPPGDAHMLVDANLASLKTDPAVDRDIRYEVFRNNDGQYVGRTRVRYTHTGSFDFKTTRYRTYTRLYVPQGSELVRAEGTLLDDLTRNPSGQAGPVDVGEELGMTVFGAFTAVEPGQERELAFEYILPDRIADRIAAGRYTLAWLKQIGAAAHALTLDLDFDRTLEYASPAEPFDQYGDDRYKANTIIDQDRFFEVGL